MGGGKRIPEDVRKQIVTLSKSGLTTLEISRIIKRPPSTVQTILNLYRATNSIAPRRRSRPTPSPKSTQVKRRRNRRAITEADKKALRKLLTQNKHSNYKELSRLWSAIIGKPMCESACSLFVRQMEQHFHKSFSEEKSALCQNRLTWAEQHQNWTTDQWDSVHFSGECRFEITTYDNQILSNNEEQSLIASVLAWGYMSARGVGSLHFIQDNLSADNYIELLETYIKPKADECKAAHIDFRFQQDSSTFYQAETVKKWFLRNSIQTVPWVPFSPNLSPMNTLWQSMKETLSKTPIRNETELRLELQSIWYSFGPKECKSVVHTMPERVHDVIDRYGGDCCL